VVGGFPRVLVFANGEDVSARKLHAKVKEMHAKFTGKMREVECSFDRRTGMEEEKPEKPSIALLTQEKETHQLPRLTERESKKSKDDSEECNVRQKKKEESSGDQANGKGEQELPKKNLRKRVHMAPPGLHPSLLNTKKVKEIAEAPENTKVKNNHHKKEKKTEVNESCLGPSVWSLLYMEADGLDILLPDSGQDIEEFISLYSLSGRNRIGKFYLRLLTSMMDFPLSQLGRVVETGQEEMCDGSGPNYSMADCLQLFFQEEKLTTENEVYCPVCKVHRLCTRKLDLWTPPKVLIVHFKRFKMTEKFGGKSKKISSRIKFSPSLDLSRYLPNRTEASKSTSFTIYAIINHFGTLESGHYKAACLNFQDQKWYEFDDTKISPASQDSISRHTASVYILFLACN
jgi:hypothetical protein